MTTGGQTARSWRALRIFRAFGVDVYLHWSWLIGLLIVPQLPRILHRLYGRVEGPQVPLWLGIVEYLCLFAIVLLHEFGHALACQSVGGRANQIVLWPLGGIAFVQPPPRPGAVLWSIAAGPLVNVLLTPLLILVALAVYATPLRDVPWLLELTMQIAGINLTLLIFNMLPIFPLDGGQILQALLWFIIGRANSLLVCAVLGIVGAAGMGLVGYLIDPWLILLAAFAMMYSISAVRMALAMIRAQQDASTQSG